MDNSTQQLRQQILSLAISGKLVPQDETEGTAQDLLKQIEAEKAKLIKEGKIKKNKPLSEITDEEIPFDIPQNWTWCRLGDIEEINLGFTYRPQYVDKGVAFLSIKDISKGYIDFSNAQHVTQETYDNAAYGSKPQKGDILYGRVGTIGKPQIIETDTPFCIFVSLGFLRDHTNILNKRYICYWIDSYLFSSQVDKNVSGTTLKNLNTSWLRNFLIPLPPLAEQKRIVAKLEVLMKELDTIEQTKQQIEHYAKQLQGMILQEAVQGKLVPQIASEGNAEKLLQQIETERKKTNPKYKPLPPVSDEEKPFEIPESWKWVRLGDVFSHSAGKQLSGDGGAGKPHKYITTSNLYWGRFELDNLKEMNFTDAELEKCSARKGDLLVCEGGDIGRSAIWCYEYEIQLQNHVHRLRPVITNFCVDFFYHIIFFYKNIGLIGGKGIGIQGLSANTLKNFPIPLPPLEEQKRIVAKLEELLGEVEKLKR